MICFAQLPDTSFTEIPVFAPYTEAERAEIIRWARQLDAESGTLVCPQLSQTIANWLEAKRQQAIDADSHAMDTLRRRAGVMGFRAGMLCYLLENRKFTKTVAQFAEWVAEYVFRNQMELWGDQLEQELTGALDISPVNEVRQLRYLNCSRQSLPTPTSSNFVPAKVNPSKVLQSAWFLTAGVVTAR